jgi:hypothetical protein
MDGDFSDSVIDLPEKIAPFKMARFFVMEQQVIRCHVF